MLSETGSIRTMKSMYICRLFTHNKMILIKRLGYLVILLYLFVACGGDEDEPVSFLISKMEYIDIAAKDTTNM